LNCEASSLFDLIFHRGFFVLYAQCGADHKKWALFLHLLLGNAKESKRAVKQRNKQNRLGEQRDRRKNTEELRHSKTAGNKPPPYKILQELHKKSVRHNKKDRTQRYGLKNQ